MFEELEKINIKPEPFQFSTVKDLWTDDYTSMQMLKFHLDENVDISSRRKSFIDRSVNWITSRFRINNNSSICDFGCGPGLYTTALAEKGAHVTGIDFSKRSIEYAKETAYNKGLKIDYVLKNYLTFDTDKKYDLIMMIMCDYCALSPSEREKLLQIFYKILKPEGFILLDVYTLDSFNKINEQSLYEENQFNGFWSSEKYYGFLNVFKYEKEKVTLNKYTVVEKNRIRQIYNWLQYFSKESLISEFESNKFIVQSIYSNVAGDNCIEGSSEMAIIAQRG